MKRTFKIMLLSLLSTGAVIPARAQFLGGLFSQQATKEKLMAEQVAGYELYFSALKSGYQIAETGLNAAHELKGGTFSLHTAYFNSLEQVNPVVQNDPKGKAIAALQQQVASLFAGEISWQQKAGQLSPAELAYLKKVATNLIAKSNLDMDELTQVLTPGKLQLTDQQRLERLDHLYAAMQDKQAFAASFTAKCRKLATGRQQAKQQQEQLRKLYGIQ
jgi:hypothetical protein